MTGTVYTWLHFILSFSFFISGKNIQLFNKKKLTEGDEKMYVYLVRQIISQDGMHYNYVQMEIQTSHLPRIGESVCCNDIDLVEEVEVIDVVHDYMCEEIRVILDRLEIDVDNRGDFERFLNHYLNHEWILI